MINPIKWLIRKTSGFETYGTKNPIKWLIRKSFSFETYYTKNDLGAYDFHVAINVFKMQFAITDEYFKMLYSLVEDDLNYGKYEEGEEHSITVHGLDGLREFKITRLLEREETEEEFK